MFCVLGYLILFVFYKSNKVVCFIFLMAETLCQQDHLKVIQSYYYSKEHAVEKTAFTEPIRYGNWVLLEVHISSV